MVKQHLRQAESVATGLRVLAADSSRAAADLAAWRFYDNDAVSLLALGAPLLERARLAVTATCQNYALCVHDQSGLHFTRHQAKLDRKMMYSRDDLGYEMSSALLLSDRDGQPLAPAYLALAAADGVYTTRREEKLPLRPWVDEVNRTMGHLDQQGFTKPLVHIIDRELDKLLHLRRFARCQRLLLIRANDVRRIEHQQQSLLLSEVEAKLSAQFKLSRTISYHGKKAWQYVAETQIVLNRPARIYRQRNGKTRQRQIAGRALSLRLILAQARNAKSEVLATWRLWTNLPPEVSAETVAQWYYWRWRIESFHKLLKRAGQHIEQWQQTNVRRIAKRLLVAAQACVIIWALQQSKDPESAQLRTLLLRLSGRQMRRGVAHTAPALLAGYWNLLAIVDALDDHPVEELRQMAQLVNRTLGLKVAPQ